MRHVFDDLGYRRYEWKCDSLNAASRRAAIRLGFIWEGRFRNAVVYKGRNRCCSRRVGPHTRTAGSAAFRHHGQGPWGAVQLEGNTTVHLNGGEIGFDGGMKSRDACRAPLTRKSDGTSVNCGQSVRSRCLIKQ